MEGDGVLPRDVGSHRLLSRRQTRNAPRPAERCPHESAIWIEKHADISLSITHHQPASMKYRKEKVMLQETVLPLDVAEALADLVRLDAQVAQCLPAHVSSALKSS